MKHCFDTVSVTATSCWKFKMVCQLHICYKIAQISNAENQQEIYGTTGKRQQELNLGCITSSQNINIDFLPSLYKHIHADAVGGVGKGDPPNRAGKFSLKKERPTRSWFIATSINPRQSSPSADRPAAAPPHSPTPPRAESPSSSPPQGTAITELPTTHSHPRGSRAAAAA